MSDVHIITDSAANLPDPTLPERFPITIVPNTIKIGDKLYREGIDLTPEEALQRIAGQPRPPTVIPPGEADYARAYNQVSRSCSAILSIHPSRELFGNWYQARRAAQQLSGHCPIAVIDSQSLCMGQGLLVQAAAELLSKTSDFNDLIRRVRGKVESIYSIYYVETVDYLVHNKIMSDSHGILGAMLGIKPCLTIENGRLMPIEKVRTRQQAVERLIEFIIEFEELQEAVILQHTGSVEEQTRLLRERLQVEFPDREFPLSVYNASLAALIGADATGLVILEDVEEDDDDV